MSGFTIQHGQVMVDMLAREVTVGGKKVALTKKEYDLLVLFLRHPRRVLSYSDISGSLWEYDASAELIWRYVANLRKHLGDVVQTVRGVGYRLADVPA